ncbi:MAG TPA: class I SAM-dependent methyltransferase, partial [Candidatus Limnocylindrales bacterium]
MVTSTNDPAAAQRDAFIEHIRSAAIGAFEIGGIALGIRLGLYAALRNGGPATSVQLAARTELSERTIREWLEHQAVNGLLDLASDADDPTARRYVLSEALAEVLLDRDSLAYFGPTAAQVLAALGSMAEVETSFRTGGGFSFATGGDETRISEGEGNRPAYLRQLGQEWLPSIPEIHTRLLAEPSARIADIGCGLGWSSIGMALAYPGVRVHGVDLDEPSIEMARGNAASAGVADRVTFIAANAARPGLEGRYDLVTIFEAFHDMAHPVAILAMLRDVLADGGSILIA